MMEREAREENKRLSHALREAGIIMERAEKGRRAQERARTILSAQKKSQEDNMDVFLRNCPDVILLFDHAMRIVFCTEPFLAMAGIASVEAARGSLFAEAFARQAEEAWVERVSQAILDVYLTQNEATFHVRVTPEDADEHREYQVHITPVKNANQHLTGAMAIFSDLTELIGERDRAEAASNAKSDFLAKMSHEIRTPMNAIIGTTEVLQHTVLTDEQVQQHVQNIKKSSTLLLSLINDILDFSKIEAGSLEIIPVYFHLKALLQNTNSFYSYLCQQKNIVFVMRIAPDVPDIILGDEKRMHQMLSNLLNNAAKYTERGAIAFDISVDAEKKLVFSIADTGAGIREEDISRLFKPFIHLGPVQNKHNVGTGLGLTITNNIVSLMGGTLAVTSEYGKGSTFTVALPMVAGTQEDMQSTHSEKPFFTAQGIRALVVDDIELNLVITEAVLAMYEIDVTLVSSGKEALAQFERERYDIVFMDHMMPEMDGVEATQRLRARGGYAAGVPVIALPANAIAGAREMFLANGFSDFLSKPLEIPRLNECLLRWIPREYIHLR